MVPTVRYPSGTITPHGAYHLLHDRIPVMTYRSYDDTAVFHLFGGPAIPHRTAPECVIIEDLKGLIAPWQNITQKGATQDGSSYITSLYDPTEVDMVIKIRGRDPAWRRRVARDWAAAWDAKQPGELSFFDHQLGRWWAPVRWAKQPVDPIKLKTPQRFTWTAVAYDAFWRSYDCCDQFRFGYETDLDEFDYVNTPGLGSGWDLAYSGDGGGFIYTDGKCADWSESGTAGYTVVCRRNNYTSATDYQVVEIQLGSLHEWAFLDGSFNDIWARLHTSGTAGEDGVRLRIGIGTIRLSYFAGGTEHLLRQRPLLVPPLPGETFTLIAGVPGSTLLGTDDDPRMFRVLRNGLPVMNVKERDPNSPIGATYRAAGFGMHAGQGIITQASPGSVRKWSAGDNSSATQSGFLSRVNTGDQPMFDRYTLFGPGQFTIADGPGSSSSVKFGPLLPGQVVQLRADPRKRGVVDLTSQPVTPQRHNIFQKALADFQSFATANNVPKLLHEIMSLFGINPVQGNLYTLLDGRFSDAAAIPAKPAGGPAPIYKVAVSIDEGTAESAILAAGTPLRRSPF